MRLADAARHGALYPDRHLNVFVPQESHRLDQNVTRALVATLRWSRPELTRAFLAELVGAGQAPASGFQYDLGACDYEDFDPGTCGRKVVLGISRAGQIAEELPSLDDVDLDALSAVLGSALPGPAMLDAVRRAVGRPELSVDAFETLAHSVGELQRGGLPDGWVFAPGEGASGVCVLIEAKLLRWLDGSQLDRYAEVWYGRRLRTASAEGPPAPTADLVLRTWEEVAAFFGKHRQDPDARTAFLCGQLHDYLDLLGLAAFHGFRPYDFDPEAFGDSLPKFQGFADALRQRAVAKGLPLVAARPSPTGSRLAFADAAVPGELALDLVADGLRVELRIGDAPLGRLPGRLALDAILSGSDGAPLEAGEAGQELGDGALRALVVRVERHRSHDPHQVGWLEREVLHAPFDPAETGFVLSEVRRQHPPAGEARDSTGQARHAVLAIGQVIDRHAAVGDGSGEQVLERSLALVLQLAKLARALQARAPAPL